MFKLIFSLLLAVIVVPFHLAHATIQPAPAATEWKPRGPVTIVVPFVVGGVTDIIARSIADGLSNELGQRVIIENRPGAGGAPGTRDVARAAPDGLTLVFSTLSTFGSNHVFFDNPLYHPVHDFEHIITVAATPKVIVVRPDSGINSIRDLIYRSRRDPNKYQYGAIGLGLDHLYGEIFKLRSGASIQLVPYKSGAPAMVDFLGGHIQIVFDNLPLVIPHVREGRARLLAVSWPTRLKEFPDVPTWRELGYPELAAFAWYGLVAPKGTPAEAVARINQAVSRVLRDPAVIQRLDTSGAVVVADKPDQSRQLVIETFERLMKIGTDAGIQKQLRQ